MVGVLIAHLFANDLALQKLAGRGIHMAEVEQLPCNGGLLARNPHPREARSRLLIGPTNGGRMLTVVVVPNRFDPAIWHVRTAWESSAREQNVYYPRS